jgi:hypothetical protein
MMPNMNVPIDGRPQYPKLHVEIINALNGRDPTAGVVEQVGDKYILDKYPPATRTSSYGGTFSGPLEEPKAEEAKSSEAALALWPNLK